MKHTHCCNAMKNQLEFSCDQHASPFDCPDAAVFYVEKFDEYGLIVHDGGRSMVTITFCPWCGSHLPDSLRERWFDELEALGFDDPQSQPIPVEYTSRAWHQGRSGQLSDPAESGRRVRVGD